MLSWAIPLRSKNLTNNSKLLGLANAFAGGIFLMLAFGHMLPHSVSVFESIGTDKNIAFKFTLVGYLLVFFIEKIAFDSHALMHEATDDIETHSLSHGHGLGHGQGHIGGQTNAIKYTNEQSERAYTSVQHDPSTPHPVLGGLGGLGGVPLGVNKGTGTGTGTVEQSVAATVIDADDVEVV